MIIDITSGQHWTEREIGYSADITIDLEKRKRPMIVASLINIPLKDGVADIIIFDPPHFTGKGTPTSGFVRDYGCFHNRKHMNESIALAFGEIYRLLKKEKLGAVGVCLFKWSSHEVRLPRILSFARCWGLKARILVTRKRKCCNVYWVELWK